MSLAILDDPSWKIDPKKESVHYLWEILFKVRIPRIDMLGEGFLRAVGVTVSGDEELDNIMRNEVITTWKSIDGMIEIFRKGGRVSLANKDDCIKVYHYIDHHLEVWRNHLHNSPINSKSAPIDDLIDLDEFSELVFQYARWEMVNDGSLAFLRRQMGKQYKYSIAAIQEAIPTMQSIENKKLNQKAKEVGSSVKFVGPDEIVHDKKSDEFDAFTMKYDLSSATEKEILNRLPKRESYARFFEQYRQDKSISRLAPLMDDRFTLPNKGLESLNNRLGKGR